MTAKDRWGVGKEKGAPAWDRALIEGRMVDLVWGEFPHSRSDNQVYARFPGGRIVGFDGHRVQIRVEFATENYVKESGLSGDEVRKGGTLRVWFDGFLVVEEFCREHEYALELARRRISEVFESHVQFWKEEERKKLPGRKVYWQVWPGVISSYVDGGFVMIRPEAPAKAFPPVPHQREDGEAGYKSVKVSILDRSIWWTRGR